MVRSAGREPVEGAAALDLLQGVTDLWVARGRAALHFDLRSERPPDEELLGLMLGRSGKLRAPAVRAGTRLLVGYNEDLLRAVLL